MAQSVRVKGSILSARVAWVRQHGDEAYQRFLRELSPATRGVADRLLLIDWYPFDMFIELCTVIDRLHGKGDLQLCYDLGRYSAEVNVKNIYRLLFKFGSVHFLLRRATMAWGMSYDAGRAMVRSEEPRGAVVEVLDFPTPHRAHCLSVRGWIAKMLELSGAREPVVKERCKLNGDERCEFSARWR